MTIKSIIAPHAAHPLLAHKGSVRFRDNASCCGVPDHYTIIARGNGQVDLVEYRDRAEFVQHRARITARLVKAHKTIGPISDCKCPSCL
jgi:hypothetical protein